MAKYIYALTEFFGFMLQLIPVLSLLYVPYDNCHLKIRKTTIRKILFIAAIIIFGIVSVILGSKYEEKDWEWALIMANIVFNIYWLAGSIVYFLSQKKETAGKVLTYILAVQYGVMVYTISNLGLKISGSLITTPNWNPYGIDSVIWYAITTALSYPFLYHFLKKYSFQKLKRISKKNIYLVSCCSIVLFVLYVIALMAEMKMNFDGVYKLYRSVWILCLIISDILAYVIYFSCLNIEDRNAEMQVQLTASELQYKSLCSRIEEEKKMKHNMRHHFRSLITLMERKEYEELKRYLRSYLDEWERLEEKVISRNPVINHVLEYYLKEAELKGILVEHKIEVKEYYSFSIHDMTVLLGNMMENAIEACAECGRERPYITLMMKQYKKTILIEERNSCTEADIGRSERGILSSKTGRVEGYGISSMKMIAEKYRGNVEFWKKQKEFTIRIVLNIPEEREKV